MVRLASMLALAVGSGGIGWGCGGSSLHGSIGEEYSLEFDRVQISRQDLSLLIEYVRDRSDVDDKVCKLTVNTALLKLRDGAEVRGETFDRTVTLERLTEEERAFPTVSSGELRFEKYDFAADGRVEGDFSIVFDVGRTLLGTFDGKVRILSGD